MSSINEYYNATVMSSDGSKIGKVSNVFVEEGSDNPEWVTVKTGLFGNNESFVPITGSSISGDELVVPFSKDQVKDAPNFDTDRPLSESDEGRLYSHYQLARGAGATAGRTDGGTAEYAGEGRDTSGRNTDNAMTRSEERLHVGTEQVQAGTARLRKYIVTENVTRTVPVSHEEVRVEREPITEANRDAAYSGPELSEEEHELTLTAERPVVDKETVPVERVRLGTETVTEQRRVDETVRKEQIDTDGATDSADDVYPDEALTQRERAEHI